MIFMPESWNVLIHDECVKPQLFDSFDWIVVSSVSLIDFMNCIHIKIDLITVMFSNEFVKLVRLMSFC
jgi:hypothetical protein